MALGIFAMPASAQTAVWPNKPVTLVVGTPAGGAIDAYARTLADQLTKQTGGTFLVENRAGAGGNLSAEHVLKSPAEGYSIWVTTHAMFTINPRLILSCVGSRQISNRSQRNRKPLVACGTSFRTCAHFT